MEKIVTKIGDVTIERKVPKNQLQTFTGDGSVAPPSSVHSKLEDLVKSIPQPDVLTQDNRQYGASGGLARLNQLDNPGPQNQMRKNSDVQLEMEPKISLPKGISWDYKPSEGGQQGNWMNCDRTKELNKCDEESGSQSQKRGDATGWNEPNPLRFTSVSIERKKARVSEHGAESRVGVPDPANEVPRDYRGGPLKQEVPRNFLPNENISSGRPYYPNAARLRNPGNEIDSRQYVANNYNPNAGKIFSSKSPIQLSSDDEKPIEDPEYDVNDVDEEFDSEEYDEDEEMHAGEEDFMSDGLDKRVALPGKMKNFQRDGSPIVLSSEDDEKNDEDIVEVLEKSKFINATNVTNLNAHRNDLPAKYKCSEPIVVDDSFSDSSTKDDVNVKLRDGKVGSSSDGGIDEKGPKAEVEVDSGEGDGGDREVDEESESGKSKKTAEAGMSSEEDAKGREKNDPDEDDDSVLKSSETELPGSPEGDEKEPSDDGKEMDDLMELMKKGEIEGEVEDDKDYESEEEGEEKKGAKRKAEGEGEKEGKAKGKKKKLEKSEDGGGKEEDEKNIDKSKVTSANLRKNIREVMDEMKLDEATLSAQRQEAERLKRLQEQQRIIRELQKQIVLNRQNQKSQSRVLSLLQGNSQTSILKTSSSASSQGSAQSKTPNHVLVKLSNGQQTSLNNKKMIELLKNSKNKMTLSKPTIPKTLLKHGMVSPSVSIAPIVKKEPPVDEKKKKKGDVVTLSSDSEDDCIVLSEEEESEPEEDPANSGMHTSDKYNVPDEQGRVIVNVGHPESESDIFLAPQIARIIKPHQIGGIRFLYDNVIESIERFQSSTGFGCILAHSMGLGKTLQIVSFSDIFLRYTSAKTILCIMPINTIQNWLAEFNMWLPKESNSSEEVRCRDFDLYIVNESLKNLNARSKVILDWQKNGGVLLMGYELFRLLSLKKSCKPKKKKKKDGEEKEDDTKNKELIEEVYAALVRPGPDLVICDEGHRIKNSHATTSQALKQIRTKRRIVLTGYPLQNNLLEYWCMVDFVRPNYLGSKTEFSNMFERPIQNGQCIDSTPQDKRLMRYRAHVLHSLLEGFVQRRSHAVLQSALPEKEEYVLLLRFTPFQRKLYDTFMNEVVRTVAVPNPLKAFAVCCKIWNHPDVLYNFLRKKGEEIDLDLEEALAPSLQPSNYPFGQTPPDGMNQYPQSPVVPPWPRRGPGSRGGKVRQSLTNRRSGRGRKPAATVPPNMNTMCEKKDDSEGFNPGGYPPNYPEYTHHNSSEGMMDNDRTNRNFGGRVFGHYPPSDYGGHSNYSGTGYDNKNPLENLEDLSTGDFQSKRFYPPQGDSGMPGGFGNPPCIQPPNYPPNMNASSNPDLNTGYNNSLNRNDSRFGTNDPSKPYPFGHNYNPDYYPGANYPPSTTNTDFEQAGKANYNRGGGAGEAYYQNSRYVDNRESSMGYGMQSGNSNMDGYYPKRNPDPSYQQGNMNKHYPGSNPSYSDPTCGSNPGVNYPNPMMNPQRKPLPTDPMHNRSNYTDPVRPGDSNYPRGDYQGSGPSYPSGYRETSNYNCNQSDSEREMNHGSNFQGANSNFNRSGYHQDYWGGSNWPVCGFDSKTGAGSADASGGEFMQGVMNEGKKFGNEDPDRKSNPGFGVRVKNDLELDSGFGRFEDDKTNVKPKEESPTQPSKKEEDFKVEKKEEFKSPEAPTKKEDGLPYDWATDLFKNYVTGVINNSSKMEVFFHILTESMKLGDRLLVFSQSLLTLDLIEDYLHRRNVPNREEKWAKNRNYFRLDGSTPGLEREKLINEFNSNSNIFIFLVSTRAGSLGINLVGANRVVVFDASWNPCHDTQAVCRVYRYGQQKPCFVYRLVMDSCLEKKIYDRQINKQGMADRVVDELNPDAHLSIKEVTNLCWDDQEDTTVQDFAYLKDKYNDQIIRVLLENCSKLLSKEPFQHESLLIDRKEKKLSQAEKRLAKRSYELEKQAANQPKNIYSFFPSAGGPRNFAKPIASVRPMQSEIGSRIPPMPNRSKWIPAEVWQKQGMSAQEMTLPLDVVIPTNTPDKTSIVLKAGQRVMVLKSPKGIYMQLENGKIIAIRTSFKVGQGQSGSKSDDLKKDAAAAVTSSLKNNPNLTITSKSSNSKLLGSKSPFIRPPEKKPSISVLPARSKQILGKTKPLLLNRKFQSLTPEIRQRLLSGKTSFESPEEKTTPTAASEDGDDRVPTKDGSEEPKHEGSTPVKDGSPGEQKKAEEKPPVGEKGEVNNSSLETLRKVTENIKDDSKTEAVSSENSQVQMNSLKNYRHNFSSQLKSKDSEDEKELKTVSEGDSGGGGASGGGSGSGGGGAAPAPAAVSSSATTSAAGSGGSGKNAEQPPPPYNGNENVQNWLMNQSYPPVDPYGNYFPSYYGYGHGPGPMVNPYEGLYPNNYPHISRNKHETQPDTPKTAAPPPPHQPSQPSSTAPAQTTQSSTSTRSGNSMYSPYSNPYQYPYNYPSNSSFNNQTYPFSGQSQNSQSSSSSSTGNSNTVNPQYDNSMYSAFHRPEGHFQGAENYPYRPPYTNSNTPGFFPYNSPYRPYPETNYHYGTNFNPYMHPPGYGYPMQNTSHNNNSVFNQHNTEPATNSS